MQTPLEMVMQKAIPKIIKSRRPEISLKTNTPHKAAISPGPLLISGNARGMPSAAFATNQDDWAVAQMIPDAKPGRMVTH